MNRMQRAVSALAVCGALCGAAALMLPSAASAQGNAFDADDGGDLGFGGGFGDLGDIFGGGDDVFGGGDDFGDLGRAGDDVFGGGTGDVFGGDPTQVQVRLRNVDFDGDGCNGNGAIRDVRLAGTGQLDGDVDQGMLSIQFETAGPEFRVDGSLILIDRADCDFRIQLDVTPGARLGLRSVQRDAVYINRSGTGEFSLRSQFELRGGGQTDTTAEVTVEAPGDDVEDAIQVFTEPLNDLVQVVVGQNGNAEIRGSLRLEALGLSNGALRLNSLDIELLSRAN